MDTEALRIRRDQLFGAGSPLFYDDPLEIVRGEGVWLYDSNGRQYLDMYNNVPCVGHANPYVVAAMQKQAGELNIHSRYLHPAILDFAEKLTELHAEPLTSVVFSCTGTEANEIAIMIARAVTEGRGIICSDSAYHGNSAEVGKLTHTRARQGEPEGHVRGFPFPQKYRPIEAGLDDADLRDRYLAKVQSQIDAFERNGVPFAGLIVCSLFANEGLPDVPLDFFPKVTQLVHEAGGLVIADEVQAGYARSGRWWGYEKMGFVPDIVTTGKPMGNGLPLAATVASADHVSTFRRQTRYFNTFASSPLQAAVGSAVLDVIQGEDLRTRVTDVGDYMKRELLEIQKDCEQMGDVRGHGTFIGIDWVTDRESREADPQGARQIANVLKEKGFLTNNAGALGNVIKLRPPLVFERKHADLFLSAFREVLNA